MMTPPPRTRRRTVLITGGSKGIGLAVAKRFAYNGDAVVIVARKRPALDRALDVLQAIAPTDRILALEADVGGADAARESVATVIETFGSIDVIVNNAATNPHFGPLIELTDTAAARTAAVNQYAPVVWSAAAWRASMCAHGGAVVNVASLGATIVNDGIAYYNATKAALVHITRHLANELAPAVRVNAVAPGLVKTDLSRALWETKGDEIAAMYPLKRLGEPEDVADAVVFLAGSSASWITGQTLIVDGGASVMSAEQIVGGW